MRNLTLVFCLLLLAPVAQAQTLYDFVIDPNQSAVSLDFSVSYDGDPWIEADDSSPVQGTWQAAYTPGAGDLQTVSLRNGAIVLNEPITLRGSEKIAVIEISVEGTLRDARLEFVEPSDEADIDASGDAFLRGHKLRLTGTFDYGWRIECDFGTTESDSGTYRIDAEVPAPTDYTTSPFLGVEPGGQVTGTFDCAVEETFTCNLFWFLNIRYNIVGKAIAPDGSQQAPAETPSICYDSAQALGIQADGAFYAAAFNYRLNEWVNWIEAAGDTTFLYNLAPGGWTALCLYDYDTGQWGAVQYAYREAW